jgi:hypothetical protein
VATRGPALTGTFMRSKKSRAGPYSLKVCTPKSNGEPVLGSS